MSNTAAKSMDVDIQTGPGPYTCQHAFGGIDVRLAEADPDDLLSVEAPRPTAVWVPAALESAAGTSARSIQQMLLWVPAALESAAGTSACACTRAPLTHKIRIQFKGAHARTATYTPVGMHGAAGSGKRKRIRDPH